MGNRGSQPTPRTESVGLAPIRTTRTSLVEQTHERLLQAISSGHLAAGERLPSEPQLAAQLGVSRGTVREALGLLQQQGHIDRRLGDGTYIAHSAPAFVERLELFTGIDRVAQEQGIELQPGPTKFLSRPTTQMEARKLLIGDEELVHVITRTLSSDVGPLVYMIDVVPDRVLSLEEIQAGYAGVIRGQLAAKIPAIAYARAEIFTTWAEPKIATRLELPVGATLVVIEETVFTADDRPVEYSLNHYNAGRCRFQIVQRRLDTR